MANVVIFDADFLEFIEYVEENENPRRYLRDAENPLEFFNDDEFVKRYRFTKDVVLHQIVPLVAGDGPSSRGLPIPAIIKVICALRFYGSNSFQNVCGDLHKFSQSTVSRIVKVVSHDIANHLQEYVKFPGPQGCRQNWQGFYEIGGFPGVTGCIDCTHVGIVNPGGQFAELYRNRKGYMSLNVQVVGSPDLEILDIVTRWPGSTHDARIFNNSRVRVRFETQELSGHLLGDNGYPQLRVLYTPVLNPATPAQIRYNTAHKSTRNLIERLFGVWKRRFSCLGQKLRTNLNTSSKIILACAVLHNIAIRCNVPLPPDDDDDGHHPHLAIVPVHNVNARNNRGAVLRTEFVQRHFN